MTALNPVMTCGDQIDEVLATHTELAPPLRRSRILEILRDVQLPEPERMIASYPHQLSGGQRQRIMIAMALVLGPRLLIADEPTTALDVTTQAQILELIRDLQRKHGTGVLFITHDFGIVAEIADRVVVLRRGQVVELGPARELLAQPRHEYTQILIASVPSLEPRHRAVVSGSPVVLRTEQLSKTYTRAGWLKRSEDVVAATAVSLRIRRGETLGIVGESGSGKSTVARCIARLVEPTAGRILLDGGDVSQRDAAALRSFRRRVQIVFQDPYRSLNPRRTVGDAIIEGPMNYGASRTAALANARRLMQLVRLDPDALDRFPHQFSGGAAAAHLHRPGAGDGARAAYRRRGGVGARCLGAGTGARAARRNPRRPQSGDAVHHPRSSGRRAGLRPRGGDAQGADRGRGARERALRASAARVHQGTFCGRAGKGLCVRRRCEGERRLSVLATPGPCEQRRDYGGIARITCCRFAICRPRRG